MIKLLKLKNQKKAVVECFTTPKKQKTSLLEKLLGKQFEGNQTTITVSENEIVQADISSYKSPSPSVKRAALLLKNLSSCMKIYNLINNYL